MVRRGFFSHVSPSGARLSDRLRRSGYIHGKQAPHVGEAVAWGAHSTPSVIVGSWIASPTHHRILLGRDFREVGVGVAAGTPLPTTGARGGVTYTLDAGASGDSIFARADALPRAFACTATHGGLDAAWVSIVGELD
jgi:uncharacterized protein YkwD